MRVERKTRRHDRGAVLPIVAAFMVVAVIFLAFVIDLGNQRQDRRQLTTATDAAALDVAHRWADNSLDPDLLPSFIPVAPSTWDCTSDAQDFLNRNRAVDAGDYACQARRINGQLAAVQVSADGTTPFQFGDVTGQDEGRIGSTTTVRISSTEGGGLRPFAVCAYDPAVLAWIQAGGTPSGLELTVGGPKFLPPACEQNNANWGFVQFESQPNGASGIADVIRQGSSDPVASFDNGDGDYDEEKQVCIDDDDDGTHYNDQDPVTCVFQATGAGGWNSSQTEDALSDLISSGVTFSLPVYGERADLGGSATGFPIIAFAEVQLVDFNASGANDNSMTLKFLRLTSGDCCEVNDSNQVLELCDVGTTGGEPMTAFQNACEDPSDVDSGTANPPPDLPECAATSVTPDSASESASSGNKLDGAVVYVLQVEDATGCTDVTAVADRGSGPTPSADVTVGAAADTFDVTFAAGTGPFHEANYAIEIDNEGSPIDSSARLTITAPAEEG